MTSDSSISVHVIRFCFDPRITLCLYLVPDLSKQGRCDISGYIWWSMSGGMMIRCAATTALICAALTAPVTGAAQDLAPVRPSGTPIEKVQDPAVAAAEVARFVAVASRCDPEYIDTVRPGDGPGDTALQFHGRPGAPLRVLYAIRDTLQSPDMLQTGQRLTIPS
ncbi:hypothetical protein ABMC89_13055 [Sulfitobacter sp. HNIBRBA3233]|uniref:hypothetical protein n=1 Tax=Sulfitobacter marinivivus TaxID=3158558 RepID=UPI0032E01723